MDETRAVRGGRHRRIDETLLPRAAAGDPDAIRDLWEEIYPALVRSAHGRIPAALRSVTETEDLVLTAVGRVFQRLPEFDGKGTGAFITFLRTVVRNVLVDLIRSLPEHPTLALVGVEESAVPTPAELAEARDEEEKLERDLDRAFEVLREKHRDWYAAQVLRSEIGLEYEQIGAITKLLFNISREIGAVSVVGCVQRTIRMFPVRIFLQ